MDNFGGVAQQLVDEGTGDGQAITWAPKAKTAAAELLCSQLHLLASDLEAFCK